MYATPKAFDAAMKARAQNEAGQGRSVGDLMRRFYFQRLLARVFSGDPEGWMVKGGQALLIRYPGDARHSRDIDLYRQSDEELRMAVQSLKAIVALDLNDYLTFTMTGSTGHNDGGSGAKVTFDVSLGTRHVDSVSVDLVVGRTPTSEPTIVRLQPAISIPWPDDWPEVVLYPIADHIADKICAMYEWHNGIASTRFRDLADLLLIAQRESLNGKELRRALISEQARRLGLGRDLRLPTEFHIPDATTWERGYRKAAADVVGLVGSQNLDDATAAASIFLTPILARSDPGQWLRARQQWISATS